VKLKVGFGVDEDATVTRAVREAIGPDIALMVDANHAYDAVAAIRLGRMIEPYDIGWFEEPVPPEDLAGYRAVKAALSIPVAGGECEYTRFGFREVLTSQSIDILQPDTCAAGGLTECKKIADMAEAFGVRYNPHVWGTGIAIAASLQLSAVLPTHTPLSLAPLDPMLEFDRTEHPIRQSLLVKPIEHSGGIVSVPDGPGIGIEVDREAMARFTMKYGGQRRAATCPPSLIEQAVRWWARYALPALRHRHSAAALVPTRYPAAGCGAVTRARPAPNSFSRSVPCA
jgi:D-galactarolactone cycloisomerase